MYALYVYTTILLILSLKVTPMSLLHSRVKHSITHISIIICSSYLIYINIKINMILYCMQNYYFGYELSFSKFDFNGLDLFIYVTGFTKTVPISTRNEIQFIADY